MNRPNPARLCLALMTSLALLAACASVQPPSGGLGDLTPAQESPDG